MSSNYRSLACLAIAVLCTCPDNSNKVYGDVVVSNAMFTETGFSLDVAGTLPALTNGHPGSLLFEHPTLSTSPGFVVNDNFVAATAISFSGSQKLEGIGTGNSSIGDYFFVFFTQVASHPILYPPLAEGETFQGTLTASWDRPVFNLDATDELNVHWGTFSVDGGAKLFTVDTVAVPEPSPFLLFATCSVLFGAIQRCRSRILALPSAE